MTFCLGVKVAKGIVAISDSRITSGTEVSTKKKLYTFQNGKHNLFLMTSGLRSVRDKTLLYFEQLLDENFQAFDRMYKAVNAFGEQLRLVSAQDKAALMEAGLHFNLWTIIGGQMPKDEEHKLFLVYPEGNWVEVTQGSPFIIIGNSGFGKPILNRNIKYETSLEEVIQLGFLAFDSTRVSANDVDFPIDVLVYPANSFDFITGNYSHSEMEHLSVLWNTLLNDSVKKLPLDWAQKIVERLK